MELVLKRKYLKENYTIGVLYNEGKRICDTLEDRVRTLNSAADKIAGKTAIPYGRYKIAMNIISPKYSTMAFYREVCQGRVPRLINVPYFEGILFHVADGYRGAELVAGCIGVGDNMIKGGLLNGKATFRKLYAILNEAYNRGEEIWITIER